MQVATHQIHLLDYKFWVEMYFLTNFNLLSLNNVFHPNSPLSKSYTVSKPLMTLMDFVFALHLRTLQFKLSTLSLLQTLITESFGKGSIMWLGRSGSFKNTPVVSTGSFALDVALGIGGLPKGRVVEIYGPEASGKTTLALHVIAEAQKQGALVNNVVAAVSAGKVCLRGSCEKIKFNIEDSYSKEEIGDIRRGWTQYF